MFDIYIYSYIHMIYIFVYIIYQYLYFNAYFACTSHNITNTQNKTNSQFSATGGAKSLLRTCVYFFSMHINQGYACIIQNEENCQVLATPVANSTDTVLYKLFSYVYMYIYIRIYICI